MSYFKNAARISLVGFVLGQAAIGFTSEGQSGKPGPSKVEAQPLKGDVSGAMPIYVPPKHGVPGGRRGGRTRGPGKDQIIMLSLSPDHTGLTVQEQPTLYWFLSKTITAPIEFILYDGRSVFPRLEVRLSPSDKPGVQRLRLSDYRAHLLPGVKYEWTIALVLDPKQRGKDIVAGGVIEHQAPPAELAEKLAQAGKTEAPYLYAEAGFWYDAVGAISDLIDATPDDPFLRKQRASLLEQVGLSEIAQYDVVPVTSK